MMTGRDFGNAEIGVLDLASGELTNVTNHPARDSEPAWSRDGRWLAFTRRQAEQPRTFGSPGPTDATPAT